MIETTLKPGDVTPGMIPVRVTGPCEGVLAMDEYPATLTRDVLWLPPASALLVPPRAFHSRWLSIVPCGDHTAVSQSADYSYDGPWDALLEAAPHDGIYQFCADIVAAWGWVEADVLEWANNLFLWAMMTPDAGYVGKPAVPTIKRLAYYAAVRELGQTYHDIKTKGLWPVIAEDIGDRLAQQSPAIGDSEGMA